MIDIDFLALHAVAVKKAGPSSAVAGVLDADSAAVEQALGRLAEAGLVIEARGTWMATPSGRTSLDEEYPTRYAALRADADADAAYARFERINRDLLGLFTDWQSVPTAGQRLANDHSDPAYDAAIIDRLGRLHDRSAVVLDALEKIEPRLRRYRARLEHAFDRVLADDVDYVSGVRIDSYHTVWFELHEDLLRMLGRSRQDV
jgi:hypothetical protein